MNARFIFLKAIDVLAAGVTRVSARCVSSSFSLIVLLLLSACAVNQNAEVAQYRTVLDHQVARNPASEQFDAQADLSLRTSLKLANELNESLAFTGEDYLQAIIEHKKTLAGFLPTVDFGGSILGSDDVSSSRNPTRSAAVKTGYSNFNAWKQLAESAQAITSIEQKRQLLLDAQTQLMLDVVRTYYAAALAEQRVRVFANSLEVQEERVRDVAAQVQVGLVRALDHDQARAQAASTRAQLSQAKGDAANTRTALALLIGVPAVEGKLTDGYAPPEKVDDASAWLELAQIHRSDLAAATESVVAARHGVDAAFAQYYPSISINLDTFVYRDAVPVANLYTALFQANIPLFTGQRIHQDVRLAWSKFRQAKLDESLTKRRVDQSVRTAYQDVKTSQSRVAELRTQVGAAEDAFTQAVDLLRVGLATNLERLIAQETLLRSQLDMLTEELHYKTTVLELRRAAGLHPLEDLAPSPQPTTQPATQPVARDLPVSESSTSQTPVRCNCANRKKLSLEPFTPTTCTSIQMRRHFASTHAGPAAVIDMFLKFKPIFLSQLC